MRTAIYICDCMGLVSDHVDTESLEQLARSFDEATVVRRVGMLCQERALADMSGELAESGIERLLVAACSPRMSLKLPEQRLEEAARAGGVDPSLVEVANIREQCAWIHKGDLPGSSRVARDLLRMARARLASATPSMDEVAIEKKTLVIGAGAAGLSAARSLARAGVPVTLVEREPSVGGALCQLAFMFQTESWPATCKGTCIGPVQASEALFDPNIQLLTSAAVEQLEKRDGNFHAKIRLAPRYVDPDLCISCGLCADACPEETDNAFDLGMTRCKAISKPSVRAVPDTYTIDPAVCTKCGDCAPACPTGAIDLEAAEQIVEETAGAVILATGSEHDDPGLMVPLDLAGQAGPAAPPAPAARRAMNVVTAMELERMIDTGLARPSDGAAPEHVAFIQCAGSRTSPGDERHGVPYCSKTCCAVTAKQAMRISTNHPETEVSVVYYRDFRTYERALEKLYQNLQNMGIEFHNGEVTAIQQQEGGELHVQMDSLGTEELEMEGATATVECDMAVLACAQKPHIPQVSLQLGFPTDAFGFPIENQPRVIRPTETFVDRVYAAGVALGPKAIQQSVEQGAAAAFRALEAVAPEVKQPLKHASAIDEALCSSCGVCVSVCPHGATRMTDAGARVDPGFCQGCGLCAASCSSHAASLRNFSDDRLLREVGAAFSESREGEPRILAMLCYWCSYAGADMAGIEGRQAPDCLRTMRIRCSSSVNMGLVLEMFRMGVDGIIVAGCPHHSCHHMWGNWLAEKRLVLMRKLLEQMGMNGRRLVFDNIGLMHGQKFVELIEQKRMELLELGPNPWAAGESVVQGAEASWLAR